MKRITTCPNRECESHGLEMEFSFCPDCGTKLEVIDFPTSVNETVNELDKRRR